jgi:hypothetical protein
MPDVASVSLGKPKLVIPKTKYPSFSLSTNSSVEIESGFEIISAAKRKPFHDPILTCVLFPFFKSSCGYPLGSRRKENSPRAGSSELFQDDRELSSRVTKLIPSFIPGSKVSQG